MTVESSSKTRIFLLTILLLITSHELLPIEQWGDDIIDLFDPRPAVTVLFIGNSLTYANDMPFMIRKIADSAHSEYKYQITMYAPGGTTFENHWNDSHVQSLLKEKWKYVVLQGASGEQFNGNTSSSFLTYGKKLADLTWSNGSMPVLFVTWRYAGSYGSDTMQDVIQSGYAALAQQTGAPKVNIGDTWNKVMRYAPGITLYNDANHPSIYGSYLCALMFYRFFSHDDLEHVTYVPSGISQEDADKLKKAAQVW
jgi:hypothetical protein